MARLNDLVATPHPAGNRIDLEWKNPAPAELPHVRLVRRVGSHPVGPEPGAVGDGVVVADTLPGSGQATIEVGPDGVYRVADTGLRAEVVYYYALFPYAGAPPVFETDRHNRAAAMATGRNDLAGHMYWLLPAIYHRYDTVTPRGPVEGLAGGATAPDQNRGQLRRFLDLPGSQLDQLYSQTRALLDLWDIDRVDGRLLPLLAEWIGWKSDFRLEIAAQRGEIRNAPAIYQRVGILPVVSATVKRISGWESRPKEFVHNLFATNRPERLNLWLSRRDSGGEWSHGDQPLSLDFAYEGRPGVARDAENRLRLFYATGKTGRPTLWTKSLDPETGWSPSEPLPGQPTGGEEGSYQIHPSAARTDDGTVWLFWESHVPSTGRWLVRFRRTDPGSESGWGPVESVGGDGAADRRRPAAASDGDGVWLTFRERGEDGWETRINRHDGNDWELADATLLPDPEDSRIETDPFLVVRPGAGSRRLWLFWARKETLADPAQSRWTVAYRVKDGLDPADDGDWGPVRTLAKDDEEAHDREPFARVEEGGDLELFWASTRDGGWSVWRADLTAASGDAGPAEPVTAPPWSQRAPVAFQDGDDLVLLLRSNRGVEYTSAVYGAMRTFDNRYAGATTVHVRDGAKLALGGTYDDFLTYSYDAGTESPEGWRRSEDDWYARDTLGLYLEPDTLDADQVAAGSERLRGVLGEFLPATDRAVLIDENRLHRDFVFDFTRPGTPGASTPIDRFRDRFSGGGGGLLPLDQDFDDLLEPVEEP